MAENTWLNDCLIKGELKIKEPLLQARSINNYHAIISDKCIAQLLNIIILSSEKPGVHTFFQPYCNIPVYLFSAIGIRWHLLDKTGKQKTVILITNDTSTWELLNKICVNYNSIRYFYPIARVTRSGTLSGNIAFKKLGMSPGLIIFDDFDKDSLEIVKKENLQIGAVVIDGSTINMVYSSNLINMLKQNLTEISIINLIPVITTNNNIDTTILKGPKINLLNEGEPLLVTPYIELKSIKPLFVDEKTPNINNISSITYNNIEKKMVIEQLYALYKTLMTIPVSLNIFNSVWRIPSSIISHPIKDRIETIRDYIKILREMRDPDTNLLEETLRNLENFSQTLEIKNPKTDLLLNEIAQLSSNAVPYILTMNQTMKNALEIYLNDKGIKAIIHYWRESSFNWPPVKEPVIITCPPPRYEEWKATVPLSPQLYFILWPIEAEIFIQQMNDACYNKDNPILSTLKKEITDYKLSKLRRQNVKERILECPVSILKQLIAIESMHISSIYNDNCNSGSRNNRLVEAIPINLYPAGTLWASPNGNLTVIRNSKIFKVESLNIEKGDYIVISESCRDTNIFRSLVMAAENKNKDIVENTRIWREALITFMNKKNLTINQLLNLLKKEGLDINIVTLRNWLENEGMEATIGPKDSNALEIIGKVTGNNNLINNKALILESIRMVRGLHQNQGKILKKLVQASALGVGDEISRIIEEKFKITADDLNKLIKWYKVESISDKCTVPYYLIGTITEGV